MFQSFLATKNVRLPLANRNSLFALKRWLSGCVLRKNIIFQQFQKIGFDYIVNSETGELHKVKGGSLDGAHNLHSADLESFVGLTNLGSVLIHAFADGTSIPIFDIITGEFLGEYVLNKCKHCFPD